MQNIRGRPRMLARRHARVRFNLNGRLRSSTPHEIFPEDTTRDSILKQILVRIKKSEGELPTCRNRTNELLNIPEDSLTATRISHEQYFLDDLINFIEYSVDNGMKLQMAPDEDNRRWYAKRLKHNLLNWIARNETEIQEISVLESRIMKRYMQISSENKYLQRIFKDIKCFTNPITDSFKIVKKSSELTSIGSSKTQSSRTDYENEEDFKNDLS